MKSSHQKIKFSGFLVYASDIPCACLIEFYGTCLSLTEDEDDSSLIFIGLRQEIRKQMLRMRFTQPPVEGTSC